MAVALGLFGLATGFVAQRFFSADSVPTAGPQLAAPRPPERRPDFSLPDLEGIERNISDWDGQILVVNFWATWCSPCRQEIPDFIELQAEYGNRGVQFLGVAVDRPEEAAAFASEFGLNYPSLVGEAEALEVNAAFGNSIGALPYTAIVDRAGRVVFSHRGILKKELAVAEIEALL
jgi:peroxiredoxin